MSRKEDREFLQSLAAAIDEEIQRYYGRRRGWILPILDFGSAAERVADYISNCNRKDAVAALRELTEVLDKGKDIPTPIGEA